MSLPTPYYQDDLVTLYHGDCLEVLPHLEPVEMLLTDPPYSVSLKGQSGSFTRKGNKGTRNLNFFEEDQDWQGMTKSVLERLLAAAPLCASAYIWCGHRQFGSIVDLFEKSLQWKTKPMAWHKKCPIPAPPNTGYNSALELCVYAFRKGRKFAPPTGHQYSNVIDSDSYRHGQPGKVAHPTQKPLPTVNIPIICSSDVGDTVLDIYAGSGTTLVAAKSLGRKAIGVEKNEKYCEIIAKRLSQESLGFPE